MILDDSGPDGASHTFSFVANVNRNDDKLKANVNRFDNDNVWNAENRNRWILPKLAVSPALETIQGRSFLFKAIFDALLPAAHHPSYFL